MDAQPHLPSEVLAHYDLGEVHAWEPKAGGGIDESFVVTSASGRYHPARLKLPPWQHTSVARFLDIEQILF